MLMLVTVAEQSVSTQAFGQIAVSVIKVTMRSVQQLIQ